MNATDAERGPSKPLADAHRRLGARFEPYRGVMAPAVYNSEDKELAALRRGCGLIDRCWATCIEMFGEDRQRFLNGLVTCDVQSLGSGQGSYGFVTSLKGRIFADVTVLSLADRLRLELPPGLDEQVATHLGKYVIVDRVEIRPCDAVFLSLVGPRSAEVLAEWGNPPEATFEHLSTPILGIPARWLRDPNLGAAAWTLQVAAADAPRLFESLLESGARRGMLAVGHRAYDRLRIEEGRPLFGEDFGPDNFPQETGLEDAVSYTKGCYLGQEIVARIHYRGGVNRHLRGLVFAGEQPAEDFVGRKLVCDGREVGTLTSAAASRRAGSDCVLGLAILHRRAEPGAQVRVEGLGDAEVVALPFRRS